MWDRLKRLIDSYLDSLTQGRAGSEVREVRRAEIAQLNEVEVQARAAAKMLERELADLELKLVGATERERILREQGDARGAAAAKTDLDALSAHRDLLKTQLAEAHSSAERARGLREQRKVVGEELATQTHITSMQETLAGLQSPFDADDPAATLDEMRARIARSKALATEDRTAEADRQLEAERRRSRVDDLLAQYKQGQSPLPKQSPPESKPRPATSLVDGGEEPEQEKTLGPAEGPVRPVD